MGPQARVRALFARAVAGALSYTYIDTGAMYRAVAWAVLEQGVSPDDPEAVASLAESLQIHLLPNGKSGSRVLVDDTEITEFIRTPSISNLTSPLSAIPRVRTHMVQLQRAMGQRGGVVMEGRDIGTVVLPNAEVKVFLTASVEKRAQRRLAELEERGISVSYDSLLADIAERDDRDKSRDIAPMVPARDSIILDTDSLTVEQVVDQILKLHTEALGSYV